MLKNWQWTLEWCRRILVSNTFHTWKKYFHICTISVLLLSGTSASGIQHRSVMSLERRTTQKLIINKSKCFNTYKKNKKNNTLAGQRRFYTWWILQRTCDLCRDNSAASRSLHRLLSVTRAEEVPCNTLQGLVEDTVCSPSLLLAHRLYMTAGFVSLSLGTVATPPKPYIAAISPSLRCRAVCTTARPDSLQRNAGTVRQ